MRCRRLAMVCLLALVGCGDDKDDGGTEAVSTTGSSMSETTFETTGDLFGCTVCNSSPLCHNQEVGDQCLCDPGYSWANPDDPADLTCERIPSKPGSQACVEPNTFQQGDQCFCTAGFIWCSEDPADLTCCEDPAQG